VDSPADSKIWSDYNAAQATRGVRTLCLDAMAFAGAGNGRRAIDLGCGAGKETLALLDGGWRVLAVDSQPDTRDQLLATVPAALAETASADAGFRLVILSGPGLRERIRPDRTDCEERRERERVKFTGLLHGCLNSLCLPSSFSSILMQAPKSSCT